MQSTTEKLLTTVLFLLLFIFNGCAQEKDAMTKDTIAKTDEEWKEILSQEQYGILRKKETEPAFTGKYYKHKEKGIYVCAACGNELFTSDQKYDSGSGWPSFSDAVGKEKIKTEDDVSFGMARTEVMCNRCGGHLGHVFDDGPKPTGLRYCINSGSLDFKKKPDR